MRALEIPEEWTEEKVFELYRNAKNSRAVSRYQAFYLLKIGV